MKKKIVSLILIFCCIFISACGNQENAEGDASQAVSYQRYHGFWSVDGLSHEDIIRNGGTEFYVEISDDHELKGSLYTQQSISDRFAEIEDITGKIIDGKCSYSFSDDGWGNSGTLFIQFHDNEIDIEVKDFVLDSQNTSGYGISGSYKLIPMDDSAEIYGEATAAKENDIQTVELQKYHSDWTENQIIEEFKKRKSYEESCSFQNEVIQYLENVREIRDISMYFEPLYATDTEYYTSSDFDDVPPLLIHIAKNEIYARHGYIFKDSDLNSYFMCQLWYLPEVKPEEFDTDVFNEYEMENLRLLAELDTYINE